MPVNKQVGYGFGFILSLLLCVAIYYSGLPGMFLVDDNTHLSALNHNGGVTSIENALYFIFGNNSGVLGRSVSMLSFLLNDQYYPGSVSGYRFTNLMIHCLCGVALFYFISRFLEALNFDREKAIQISLLSMLWWLLAPINVSTTLYIIQRMSQLSSLFVLMGLIFFLKGRMLIPLAPKTGTMWSVLGLYGMGAIAVLSKENGALIFVYAVVCEFAINFSKNEKSHVITKYLLYIPIATMVLYFCYTSSSWLSDYNYRNFTFGQRLLTESRILIDYLVKALFSNTSSMGLMQDDIVVSTSLFSPLKTIISIVIHLFILSVAWFNRRKFPIVFFGVGWFYGGHILESSFLSLELYFEHRNYLPLMGVYVAVVALVLTQNLYKKHSHALLFVLIILAGFMCYKRASLWGDPEAQITSWASEHPESLRAQSGYAKLLLKKRDYYHAHKQLIAMKSRWPNAFHIDLMFLSQNCFGHIDIEISFYKILMELRNAKYTSQVASELEGLKKSYVDGACEKITSENMHDLFQGVLLKDKFPGKVKSSAAFWDSELYIEERNLNGAMGALGSSYHFHKDSIPHYIRSRLLASAGLLDEALIFIKKAIDFELSKPRFKRKNVGAYMKFRDKIVELINKNS